MYEIEKTYLDLSNELEDIKQELPPYAREDMYIVDKNGVVELDDEGKPVPLIDNEGHRRFRFLNDSPLPKVVKVGEKNIKEFINSFKDEVDIVKMIQRYKVTNDPRCLDIVTGKFGDISMFPNDRLEAENDFKVAQSQELVNLISAKVNELNKFDTTEAIKKMINESVAAALVNNKEVKGNE